MKRYGAAGVVAAATLGGCISDPRESTDNNRDPIVSGAGYTTFDAALGGCLNTANAHGISCNVYSGKDKVFLSGGPDHATSGLASGSYFFAVLAPGSQLAGFLDGGGGDPVSNRTFVVEDHEIIAYAGTHAVGETPNGRVAIGLAPFDDTDNPGGVYILAICAAHATDPSQCTYDAFRIRADDSGDVELSPQLPIVHGGVFYDANLDGSWDRNTEPGIPSWHVAYHDTISGSVETDADGLFTLELIPDGYLFVARDATSATVVPNGDTAPVWLPTGSTAAEITTEGGAYANRNADHTYWLEVDDDQVVRGVYFGMVCVGDDGLVHASPATCPLATF